MNEVHIDMAGLAERLDLYEECWYGYLRVLRGIREEMEAEE